MTLAIMILCLWGAYALIGFLFALLFVFRGVQQIDHAAQDAPLLVRLILIPGSVALWPLLLLKWSRHRSH